MDQKKDDTTDLAQTVFSILGYYENEVSIGAMDRGTAQEKAKEQIRVLRYGAQGKDYFWINDLRPYMVMHPYRPELEGQDLSDFSDQNGTFLFNEFVSEVTSGGDGFVPYYWQWKGNCKASGGGVGSPPLSRGT